MASFLSSQKAEISWGWCILWTHYWCYKFCRSMNDSVSCHHLVHQSRAQSQSLTIQVGSPEKETSKEYWDGAELPKFQVPFVLQHLQHLAICCRSAWTAPTNTSFTHDPASWNKTERSMSNIKLLKIMRSGIALREQIWGWGFSRPCS